MPRFYDVVVVSTGYGESHRLWRAGQHFSDYRELKEGRDEMINRLFNGINLLMTSAHETYLAESKLAGSEEVDMEFMLRMNTNEFFFYTEAPLTLIEFEALQNKIDKRAREIPAGVQLNLASFAVNFENKYLLNVAVNITCGNSPTVNFVLKNNPSHIDLHYKVKKQDGELYTLTPLGDNFDKPEEPPFIKIKGKRHDFQFDTVLLCTTPGGTKYLTVLEICLDHYLGIGKSHMKAFGAKNKDQGHLAITHIVTSYTTYLVEGNCLGSVLHVDPKDASVRAKAKKISPAALSCFGKEKADVLYFETATGPTLQEFLEKERAEFLRLEEEERTRVTEKYSQNLKEGLEALQQCRIGPQDATMEEFIKEWRERFADYSGDSDRDIGLSYLKGIVDMLNKDPTLEKIKTIIADMKKNPNPFLGGKQFQQAIEIEKAIIAIPITSRYVNLYYARNNNSYLHSKSYQAVKHLLPMNPLLPTTAGKTEQADANSQENTKPVR